MGRVARRDTNYRTPMTLPPNPIGGLTADIVAALHVARPRGQSNLMPAGTRKPRRLGGPGLRRLRSWIGGGPGRMPIHLSFQLAINLDCSASKPQVHNRATGRNTRSCSGVE